MLRLGAVAGLACDSSVFALGLFLEDIHVAGFTGLVTGVDDGQRRNLRNGVAAVMPIFPKTVRDEVGPKAQERQYARPKQSCDAEQMFEVLHDRYKGNFRPSGSGVTKSCVFNKSVPVARV